MTQVETCHDCNGAGGDNNTFCCKTCDGSGGLITITVGIPSARKIIGALHGKEDEWYEKGKDAPGPKKAYCEIEAQAYTAIRHAIERKMP